MKSSVYKVVGCSGSQRAVEVVSGLGYSEARKYATKLNRRSADNDGDGPDHCSYCKVMESARTALGKAAQ